MTRKTNAVTVAARRSDDGVAVVTTLLVLMLMSGLLLGFMALVMSDQRTSGANRDQSQAYAGAHAGVEKMTADLGQMFAANFAPTGAQIATLTTNAKKPALTGITYDTAGGDPGYNITFVDSDGDGNPDVEDENGTPIGAGPYQGLIGLITPYNIAVTAQTSGHAEVSMRRQLQTVAIPVFQFGIFSENNLSFFAGPDFSFGGRIHTNQNLFLKQDNDHTLTLSDRVTAVGEVIRTHLSNGQTTHNGTVRMAKAAGCPAAPTPANGNCRNLLADEGSLVGTLGSAPNTAKWVSLSKGDYNGFILNWRTGARRLDLPLVANGASPVDLIRRAPVGEATSSDLYKQRFFGLATVRVLLSDTAADITGLPSVVSTPVPLSGAFTPIAVTGGLPTTTALSFAASTGVIADGYRTVANTPSLDGFVSIEMQQRDGTWVDITKEILSLGFSGHNPSTGTFDVPNFGTPCADPHPNAVIRLQRIRDKVVTPATWNPCGFKITNTALYATSSDQYWPNVLYDPREGAMRDATDTTPASEMYWGGVMHYVELDVENLRRWLIKTTGSKGCISSNTSASCPMDVTGYVFYFSDRRTNRDTATKETGEYGWEDNINSGSATSVPNGAKDEPFTDAAGVQRWAEDVNANGTLETYGNIPRLDPKYLGTVAAEPAYYNPAFKPSITDTKPDAYNVWSTTVVPAVARANRAFFFRRALKVVNGRLGQLPANGSQGLTIAAENPVYMEGNFNACTKTAPSAANSFSPTCDDANGFDDTPGVVNKHVSAAVIADAVTFLSNAWNDIRSFRQPHRIETQPGTGSLVAITTADKRQAQTTYFRLGIIAGKGLSFTRPTSNTTQDHNDFGTDGGAHNFIRYIEGWSGAGLNYRGSLISFYTSRQAVGTYKCCDLVYGAPSRGYKFDAEFLNPNLLPPRTPMFRDINTLTFRQVLRPTEQ